MRRAARVDANQPAVVAALRAAGATVQPLHTVGGGCPDILAGFRGVNYAIEIKDGGKAPSRRALTADEREWHEAWRGSVAVVNDEAEALALIGALS